MSMSMFALAGIFVALLGIMVSGVGVYQAFRRRSAKTLIEGIVLIAVAFLLISISQGVS